jgi:WD40 repeat protein
LVSGSNDNTIKIWDLITYQIKATLVGHQNFVCTISICPDGNKLASGSYDETIKIWDLKTY